MWWGGTHNVNQNQITHLQSFDVLMSYLFVIMTQLLIIAIPNWLIAIFQVFEFIDSQFLPFH